VRPPDELDGTVVLDEVVDDVEVHVLLDGGVDQTLKGLWHASRRERQQVVESRVEKLHKRINIMIYYRIDD